MLFGDHDAAAGAEGAARAAGGGGDAAAGRRVLAAGGAPRRGPRLRRRLRLGRRLATDLGLPDVGLTTLTEVVARAGAIARATTLPTIVDADTGFGEPLSVARTVRELEQAGLAGCHLEDQVNPKRCGHLDGQGSSSARARWCGS
jgi:hypothetical protein